MSSNELSPFSRSEILKVGLGSVEVDSGNENVRRQQKMAESNMKTMLRGIEAAIVNPKRKGRITLFSKTGSALAICL